MSPDVARQALIATHGGLSLEWCATIFNISTMSLYRLICALGQDILFFVASRGHHADIGGRTPGSTPPDSTTVEEEGILFDNFKLVDAGEFLEDKLRAHLGSGR
jgi:hypothetical protein